MKKIFALLTIIMILTTALAACGPTKIECEDEFGCVEIAKDEPIRIARAVGGPEGQRPEMTQ